MSNNTNSNNSKEEFCGACLTVPVAFAGAGAASYGIKGKHKKMKKIMLWSGLIITLLSIIISIYFLFRCQKCRQ